MKKLHTKYCDFCNRPDMAFEYKADALCIECSLDFNEGMITRSTRLDGSSKKPYFLKRRLHLRELLEQSRVPRGDGLERENVTCSRCDKQFVALKINHLKFCGDCTHWKNKMEDVRLKYEESRI